MIAAKTTRVLIADGNATHRKILGLGLKEKGYDVLEAADGVTAVKRVVLEHPDLIVMDLTMPVLDGIEATKRIRKNKQTARIPVLILTAVKQQKHIVDALHSGASDYIIKGSLKLCEIAERIERLISRSTGRASHKSDGPADRAETDCTPGPAPEEDAVDSSITDSTSPSRIKARVMRLGGTKAIPFIVTELLSASCDDVCCAGDLSRIIEKDPAIASRILQLANSSFYRAGERITSVEKAVVRLGMRNVRELALSLSVMESFDKGGTLSTHSRFLFWQHCIGVAAVARALGERLGPEKAGTAFLAGLLHDIGKAMVSDCFPEQHDAVRALVNAEHKPVRLAERRILHIDHAELAQKVLTDWHLPQKLVEPVALHHRTWDKIEKSAKHDADVAGIIKLANHLAKIWNFGSSGDDFFEEPEAKMLQSLGVGADTVFRMHGSVLDDFLNLRAAMLAEYLTAQGTVPADMNYNMAGMIVVVIDDRPVPEDMLSPFLTAAGAQVVRLSPDEMNDEPPPCDTAVMRIRSAAHLNAATAFGLRLLQIPDSVRIVAVCGHDVNIDFLKKNLGEAVHCIKPFDRRGKRELFSLREIASKVSGMTPGGSGPESLRSSEARNGQEQSHHITGGRQSSTARAAQDISPKSRLSCN